MAPLTNQKFFESRSSNTVSFTVKLFADENTSLGKPSFRALRLFVLESRRKRLQLCRRHSHRRVPGYLPPPRNRAMNFAKNVQRIFVGEMEVRG